MKLRLRTEREFLAIATVLVNQLANRTESEKPLVRLGQSASGFPFSMSWTDDARGDEAV